jgi:formamidopyrimidine-DNA glycosylase
MPEGPEVETVVRGLQPIIGSTIVDVDVSQSKGLLKNCTAIQFHDILRGSMIRRITRRGKWIWWDFQREETEHVMLNHLGMFGHWLKKPFGEVNHARMQLILAHHTHCTSRVQTIEAPGFRITQSITYSDMRSWGRFYLFSPPDASVFISGRVGVDATQVQTHDLEKLLPQFKGPLVDFLLAQEYVAGIGNMYRSEILNRARIAPDRPSTDLDLIEIHTLAESIRSVINTAIQLRGSTISDYRDTEGNRGGFQSLLRAYGRHGKPCFNCGSTIVRTTDYERAVFYCPSCQR